MYRIALFCYLAAVLPLITEAFDPESLINADNQAVEDALGPAIGEIEVSGTIRLIYERGTITMTDGKVTNVKWMSDAEYELRLQYIRSSNEMWRKREEEIAKNIQIAGERKRDDQYTNPALLAATLENQINYWRAFKHSYPKVNIEPHFSELIIQFKIQLENERNDVRIVELKERAAEAQERVTAAEKAAALARTKPPITTFNVGTYTPAVYLPPVRPPTFYFGNGHTTIPHHSDHHNSHGWDLHHVTGSSTGHHGVHEIHIH